MSVETELQKIIIDKYKNIRQFSAQIDIPYTTLKGAFERGIMGMSVQNVIKICKALNVDINKLSEGIVQQATKNMQIDLDEFNIINQYRFIDESGKRLVQKVVAHEYERCSNQYSYSEKNLSVVAARSENNQTKIHTEELEDLSQYSPDVNDTL